MTDCLDCTRLREESALAFSEYLSCKDELAITEKTDKSFVAKRRAFEQAQGHLRECHSREHHHRDAAHTWNSLPSDEEVEQKVAALRERIVIADAEGIQHAIFALSPVSNGWKAVPDQVVEQLLTLLRNESMYGSEAAAHILNYFEFESPHLTTRQKSLCMGFLQAHGDQFTHFHSQQVVTELLYGDYLK
jgi:hypothetical protein